MDQTDEKEVSREELYKQYQEQSGTPPVEEKKETEQPPAEVAKEEPKEEVKAALREVLAEVREAIDRGLFRYGRLCGGDSRIIRDAIMEEFGAGD